MRTCLFLLPFLALACLRPGLAEGIRVSALLVVVLSAGLLIWIDYRTQTTNRWNLISGVLVMLGVILLSGSGMDAYVSDVFAPVLIAGALALWVPAPTIQIRLLGIFLYWLVQAGFFVAASAGMSLFPVANLAAEAPLLFTGLRVDDPLAVPIAQTLVFPELSPLPNLWIECTVLVVAILFALVPMASAIVARILTIVAAMSLCVLLTLLMGPGFVLVVAAGLVCFFLLCPFPVQKMQTSIVMIAVAGGVLGLISLGGWNPLFPVLTLGSESWFWQARQQFPALLPLQYDVALDPSRMISLAVVLLTGAFAIDVFRHFRQREWNDPMAPLAFCALGVLIVPVWEMPLWVCTHPLFWVAWMLVRPYPTEEAEEDTAPSMPALSTSEWKAWVGHPLGITAMRGLVFALLILTVLPGMMRTWGMKFDWQAGISAQTDSEMLDAFTDAYQSAIYRGDNAGLYVTAIVQAYVNQSQVPAIDELHTLEIGVNTASRFGVRCVLATKRLSDFYLLQADSQASLSVLRNGVEAFPGDVTLRELYADTLETLGQREVALEQYGEGLQIAPTSQRLLRKVAMTLRAMNRTLEAEEIEERLSILNPAEMASG